MTRILCTGDSHIGKGRDLYPARLSEQEQVWRGTLELSRSRECDLVLHAGDLWERRRPQPDEILAAEVPLVEHREQGGAPVVVICGNHDRAGVAEETALDVLAEAGLIVLAKTPQVVYLAGVAIACLPWTPVSRLVAAAGGGDRDDLHRIAAEHLIEVARELRQDARPHACAILLAHWSVSGSSLPSGLEVAALREVVLPLSEIEAMGWDAVVLGHIHRAQRVGEHDGGPPRQFYVGSPMPLDFGEGDDQHGCWILDGFLLSASFVPLESRPFVTVDLAAGDEPHFSHGVEDAIVRVRGTARSTLSPDDLRSQLNYLGAHTVAQIALTTERPARVERAAITDDLAPAEALAEYLAAQTENGNVAALVERGRGYLEGVA